MDNKTDKITGGNITKTMKYILLTTILCLTFASCNHTTDKQTKSTDNSNTTKQVIGKKFFEYDAIDYYTNISAQEDDLYENQSKSEIDSFKHEIILGNIPNSISDLAFISKLEKVGYKKTIIDKSKFTSIDSIFVEKKTLENYATACIYVYRDILIFKKEGKVVGTAKVCFGCMANQIHGTKANTENFGQDGDYEKLAKILRPTVRK